MYRIQKSIPTREACCCCFYSFLMSLALRGIDCVASHRQAIEPIEFERKYILALNNVHQNSIKLIWVRSLFRTSTPEILCHIDITSINNNIVIITLHSSSFVVMRVVCLLLCELC